MTAATAESLSAGQLGRALAAGGLQVRYQPIISLPDRRVVGMECLARLQNGDELVAPARFIATAETHGLIADLGAEVLRQAIARVAGWRRQGDGLAAVWVSVNVSPLQLADPTFLPLVRSLLREYSVPASALTLEITETVATAGAVQPALEALSAFGVRLALDDFGTGFATLDGLKRLPVRMLKIDRTFVSEVATPSRARAIVRAVIALAETLGLYVVAEGVETEDQLVVLEQLNCLAAQGFYFAEPTETPELVDLQQGIRRAPTGTDLATLWRPEHDATVLAAARLLAIRPSRVRDTVVALSSACGRRMGLSAGSNYVTRMLSLVHDHRELVLAGDDWAARVPGAADLATVLADGLPRPDLPIEVRVVAAAAGVGAVLRERPDLDLASCCEQVVAGGTVDDEVAAVLVSVATRPVPIIGIDTVLDTAEAYHSGRSGVEERMRALLGVTRAIGSTRDMRELLRLAADEARAVLGAASLSVERWDRETGVLRTLVNVGELGPAQVVFPADEFYPLIQFPESQRLLTMGMPHLQSVNDPTSDDAEVGMLRRLGKGSCAAVPILIEDRLWGRMYATTSPDQPAFEARDLELLTAVAGVVSTVVVQAEHLDAMARQAFEDALTGLGNRRVVDDALTRLSADGRPTALVLLDVDGLKEINDSLGHGAGDLALQVLGDALSASVAGVDGGLAGRLGGDEFTLLLPDHDLLAAQAVVVTLQERLASQRGPTVSCGVAVAAAGPWSARVLLAEADAQAYAVKRRRRGDRRSTRTANLDRVP